MQAIEQIKRDLKIRLDELNAEGKLLEAQRLEQRTNFDVEMIEATGSCAGIENYSRYLTGRKPGEPPPTFFEYMPRDALVFVDESHVTVPQLGGMFRGDWMRKTTLAEYGFRLPSCTDNRPLKFEEWDAMRGQTIFVSATPGPWEMKRAGGVFVEQIVRPTGLVDPPCIIRPVENQVDDLMAECREEAAKGHRVMVTTLTKKMAEALTEYLHEAGLRVRYMHSDVDTLERIEIIRDLRLGVFDVLIGINLLREGLDIPECALVAILDADKEGYLRSRTSLIQTIGRAARHIDGRAILYADRMTDSLKAAIDETNRRREKQQAYNARPRHHARKRAARHRRHPRERLRARPRHLRLVGGRGGALPGRRSEGGHRRSRKAHARGRRRPRIRGGGAVARRDPPARAGRSRPAGRGGRPETRSGRAAARRPDAPGSRRAMSRAPRCARAKTAVPGADPERRRPDRGDAGAAGAEGGAGDRRRAADRPRAGARAGRRRVCRRRPLPSLASTRPQRWRRKSKAAAGRPWRSPPISPTKRQCEPCCRGPQPALGPIGFLVNNAAVFDNDTVETATRESWDRHLAVNLRAPFVLMQDFAARLPPHAGGVVVNMLDQRVWRLTPYFVSYTLSKAGLWTLTQTMALALAPRIRVNGIGPGPTVPSPRQSAEQFARQWRRCRSAAAPARRRSQRRCASSCRRRR